jgi:hypothetical protein
LPGKIETLAVLLILLPGLTCAYIVQHLAVRRKQSELDKLVEALIFSFAFYVLTLPFFGYALPVSWQSINNQFTIVLNWHYLATLAIIAVATALLYSANLNHDWLLGLFRAIRLTDRTARSSIWNDVFQDVRGRYLEVGLADGRVVIGYLRYYSDEASEASLFLEDAAWKDVEGNQIPVDGPGILITKRSGITFINFLNPEHP